MSRYDSEDEDQPRKVIDVLGDFIILHEPTYVFKLRDFEMPKVQRDGKSVPFDGVLALRPVPHPQAIIHAKKLMGNGSDGVWLGTRFDPPADAAPGHIFPVRSVNTNSRRVIERFSIRRRFVPEISDLKTMMIYTDGACASNGLADPRAGYAFVFNRTPGGTCSGALEEKGPSGQVYQHTNNRAELRAVIAALEFRSWWGEGWKRIVIVADSEYVGKGATLWMRKWAENGWRTAAGKPVANRDLWEALSEAMGRYASGGCEISFWVVPRAWNSLADAAAKAAVELKGDKEYQNALGFLV